VYFDLLYADILYKDPPSSATLIGLISCLRPGGAFLLQTDQNSVAKMKILLDNSSYATRKEYRLDYINWIIWSYDWGGRPKDAFGRKHDDILYYAKVGGKRTFNAKAVAIEKTVMMNSKKEWKIPTDVWQGNFYTTSPERIKNPNTHKGYVWQKPLWLMNRILLACTNPGDLVFEPYAGTATMCVAAMSAGRNYVACDTNPEMVAVATQRLKIIQRRKAHVSEDVGR